MLERHFEERLDHLRRQNRLYLLYVIREGNDSWEQLLAHFGLIDVGLTEQLMLAESLSILQKAGFVAFAGSLDNTETLPRSIRITERGTLQLHALGISLSEHSQVLKGLTVVARPDFPLRRVTHDVFVATPFDDEYTVIYSDYVVPLLRKLKLSVTRADDFASPTTITDDVFNAILCARLVIADCTGRNPNVFYEIGLAHALGKPVVLITQSVDDIPFDVAHIRYLVYEATSEGLVKLSTRLKSAIHSAV